MVLSQIKKAIRKYQLSKVRFGHLGTGVEIQPHYSFQKAENVFIEDYVYIGPHAFISGLGGVKIFRGVIIGPRVKIYSANHVFRNARAIPYDETLDERPVEIHENVWIGGDVIIVPGAIIGEGVIVGAGSVVSGRIPPFSIIAGNPAKVISTRDEEHYQELKAKDLVYFKLKKQGDLNKNSVT
jgi:acetyltransferase-like isoleucine patch superfamily enzyme